LGCGQAKAAYDSAIGERNKASKLTEQTKKAAAARIKALQPTVLTGYAGDSWQHHTKDVTVACLQA
jgi:hypothetical protein|tara:strand:- start:35 stop:232 length:198 start_codon:yes stop_codon:yes gene_type:complete